MSPAASDLDLGEGVYSFPQAARIVGRSGTGTTARQLRYWLRTGLTQARSRTKYGAVLSFEDLVSLEIVRRFRAAGLSLQAVRKLERRLRDRYPTLERPFAHRIFFTDGAAVWLVEHPENPEELVEEIIGPHPNYVAWTGAVRSFADEIQFDDHGAAMIWHLNDWVDVNPAIQFGAPVVRGTRVPVRTVLANLEAGTSVQVADWYGLTVDQVEGVRNSLANS